MLELAAPQQRLLGPYRPADYASDYLGTTINQRFSDVGWNQPF